MMDDDDVEPLCVTGLGNLTAAQQALAEFLEVDPDLLAGAGMGSPAAQEKEVSQQEQESISERIREVHGRPHAAQGADSTAGEGRHLEEPIKGTL
jgi:hypothetical protein